MAIPQLTPPECRVLGVLIEKAQTTPAQYPLTLNSLTTGCNQKNNRDPLTAYGEEDVLHAVDGLRRKELVREAFLSGSRVAKFRHVARDALKITAAEMVVLAELLLRGPQSLAAIRANGARMMPAGDASLETNESTQAVLDALRTRDDPMVKLLPPLPGSGVRAARYAQLLCPDLHPLDAPAPGGTAADAPARDPGASRADLDARLSAVERDLAALARAVRVMANTLGVSVELPPR